MGGAAFPPCWLFCLRQPNTGAYLGSLVGLMADSGRAHAKEHFQNLHCQCPCPHGETEPPPASAGDPPTPAGMSGSVSPRVTAPFPGSGCTHYFVCALQEWGLCFPQSCRSPAIKSHNLWVGDTQTGEHIYHRSTPTGVKVLSPTSGFPTWGSGNGRRNS